MKKKLAHWFPPLAALALVACVAATGFAQEPPKDPPLRIPEKFEPRLVKNVVKATAAVDPNLKLVNIEAAWAKSKGEGVTVFVFDTGVDLSHPEFKGVSVERYNFTSDADAGDHNGHGTFCATEICSQQNVDGVAPKIKRLVMLKVLANNGSGDLDWMAKAIRFANKYDTGGGPKVYSASLGASPSTGRDPADVMPDLQAAIKEAIAGGAVCCFAAGNDNSKMPPNSVGLPARYGVLPGLDRLIVVAACDLNKKVTDFSSVGPATWTTVVGHDVLGGLPGGQYARWDGTSMATPIAAGIAACWLSAYGSAVAPKDRQAAFAEALRLASSFPDKRNPARGWGLPDCNKLFAAAPANPPVPPVVPPAPPAKLVVGMMDLYPAKQAELIAGGVSTFRLEITPTGTAVAAGAASAPAAPAPVAPQYRPQTVPGVWVPPVYHPAPQWAPPPQYPQYQTCPPGGCQPAPAVWVPGQRVIQWIR